MARRRPSSALETRLGSWARLLPPGLLLLLASARALEANHTERAAADSAVEVLVRTFLKRCGRNGLCQDPSLGDYYYRPLRATERRGEASLRVDCQETATPMEPLDCKFYSNSSTYCCTNHLHQYGISPRSFRTVINSTYCFPILSPGLWHEVSVPIADIANYGTDYCYMLVSTANTTAARRLEAPPPRPPSEPDETQEGGQDRRQGAARRRLRAADSAPPPSAGAPAAATNHKGAPASSQPPPKAAAAVAADNSLSSLPPPASLRTLNVTFKSPRIQSQVLDYCLADEHGNLTEACGQPVAQPYCSSFKGCLSASSFLRAENEVSGVYYAIIAASTMGGNQRAGARTRPRDVGYPYAADLYHRSFQSITCECEAHANDRSPVLYSKPVVTVEGTSLPLDACKNFVQLSRVNCGQPAADEFCQRKDMARALSFRVMPTNATTWVIGDAVYGRKGQEGFEHITCSST